MKPKQPGGRPPLNPDGTPRADVHVYMSAALFDKTFEAARRERMTLQEYIRYTLGRAVRTLPPSSDR